MRKKIPSSTKYMIKKHSEELLTPNLNKNLWENFYQQGNPEAMFNIISRNIVEKEIKICAPQKTIFIRNDEPTYKITNSYCSYSIEKNRM